MLVLFTCVLLVLLLFGGQSAAVLIAVHQGVNEAFKQFSGPREVRWHFRKMMYQFALAFCVLMMVGEVLFYLCLFK